MVEDAATGRVRLMGFSSGDNVNLDDKGRNDLDARRRAVAVTTSADSPDDRVIEGAGTATRLANEPQADNNE